MEAAIFPDAESLLTSYLRTNLANPNLLNESISVTTDVPNNPRPEEFIQIIRTGGPRMNIVADNPQITIDCWALNEERAYEIASYARALIEALEGSSYQNVAFYRMNEFSGPFSNPDPDSNIPRYTWTFTIGMRGTQLVL